jgi:carboxymethylenebutenolidase
MAYRGMTAETVSISGHNGDKIAAYVARPQGAGKFPGVVLILVRGQTTKPH